MIKKRTMGRTGQHLSELCLGTLNFGWKTDAKTAFAILDAFHAAGGNFIQSTNHSSENFLPSTATNLSEEIVGRWWKIRGLRREDLFIATRIHVRQSLGGEESFAETVGKACVDSIRRLQTTYLDMVILEWNNGLNPNHSWLEGFDHVVRNGLARYIGAANFPVWRVLDTLGRAYARNHHRMEAIQCDYSLMTRARFEPEAMALCQEQRLGYFARSPLAGGFLIRRRGIGDIINTPRREWLTERFDNSYGDAALAAVGDVAVRHEVSTAQVALAWVLHNPVVTSAIIGVHSIDQLRDLIPAGQLRLSGPDLGQLGDATAAEEVRLAPRVTHHRPVADGLALR